MCDSVELMKATPKKHVTSVSVLGSALLYGQGCNSVFLEPLAVLSTSIFETQVLLRSSD